MKIITISHQIVTVLSTHVVYALDLSLILASSTNDLVLFKSYKCNILSSLS